MADRCDGVVDLNVLTLVMLRLRCILRGGMGGREEGGGETTELLAMLVGSGERTRGSRIGLGGIE